MRTITFFRSACLGALLGASWASPGADPAPAGEEPLDRLAAALLKNDLQAARKLIEGPPPAGATGDWAAVAAQAARILDWTKAVSDSFREDIGEKVVVVSPRETISATVAGVSGGEVRLRVPVGGGFVEQTISIASLSAAERERRLKGYTAEEKAVVAALGAMRSGQVQEAAEALRKAADGPLAASVLAAIERDESGTRERDATRALRRLLDLAGFAGVREPGDEAVGAIRRKEFGADLARVVREESAGFSNRFASTQVAAEWGEVWAALAAADTRSRAIDEAAIREAIEALERKNAIAGELQVEQTIRDGKVDLNLAGNPKLVDLSPLEKLPIRDLDLTGTGVRSLVPLKSMPLERLVLDATPVESLRGIEGCPLRSLSITNTAIADLRALKGAPLEFINLYRSRVKTLAGLEGAPLKDVSLVETLVADLQPLAGAPLTNLNATSCGALVDIRALEKTPLDALYIWGAPISDLRPLAKMRLKFLQCTGLADLNLLAASPLEWLVISYSSVADLRPLAGKQITVLAFNFCPEISDLSPLAGMPLISLDFNGCPKVADLASLRGMPLATLVLDGTSVDGEDMAFVRDNFPNLVTLFMSGCKKVNDLEFLLSLKSLSSVSLPPGVKAIPVLEKHAAITTVYENGLPIPVKEYIATHGGKKGE